jgi:hypothetical protein
MAITFRKSFKKAGVLTNPNSVKLSSSGGIYGVKRDDTDAVVVADDTAMTNVSTGVYEYTFDEPTTGLTYTAALEVIAEAGDTANWFTLELTGSTTNETFVRKWQSVISYEDRAKYHTSRWRLAGVKTKEAAENTDSGVLWLKCTKSGDTVTATLYKDDGVAAGNAVATGTADVSGCNGTGENAVECVLTASNTSGLSGSFWFHTYSTDATAPVQVALCVDEDMDALWDDIENLPGYDSTYGMAEYIRVAGEDVLGRVAKMFSDEMGGHGSPEAWFITDAQRSYPDLRRIANPDQLRLATSHRALAVCLGRSHQRADETMYSELRDYHGEQFEQVMSSLALAFKSGSGDNASESGNTVAVRLSRV